VISAAVVRLKILSIVYHLVVCFLFSLYISLLLTLSRCGMYIQLVVDAACFETWPFSCFAFTSV